jgi:feruloyl esterase
MQIYPGLEPGAEAFPFNWPIWITGPAFEYPFSLQAKFGSQFFWHFFGNPTLADLRNVDVPVRVAEADTRFGMILNAVETDLRPFYDRGGKLLQYHGFDDAAVAPKNSINYWSGVSSRMRTLGLTRADIDNFYRLFMVPGLGHCLLGEGANEFGNGIRGSAMDSRHDLMLALERWVEHGVAPERLIARHREPFFERPLCPYPKLPRYNGSGVATDAANWSCVAPRSFQTKVPPFEPRPPFRVPIQPDPAPSRKPGS